MTGILCVGAAACRAVPPKTQLPLAVVSAGESHQMGRSCKGRRCRQHGVCLQTPVVRHLCLLGSCVSWSNLATAPLHNADSTGWQVQPVTPLSQSMPISCRASAIPMQLVAEAFGCIAASSGCCTSGPRVQEAAAAPTCSLSRWLTQLSWPSVLVMSLASGGLQNASHRRGVTPLVLFWNFSGHRSANSCRAQQHREGGKCRV